MDMPVHHMLIATGQQQGGCCCNIQSMECNVPLGHTETLYIRNGQYFSIAANI